MALLSRLHSRLERIEAAPLVNLIRERREARRREIEKFRASIQGDIDGMMALSQYCGLPFNREQAEIDVIEGTLLIMAECDEQYGYAKPTHDQRIDCIIQSDIKFYLEVEGREYSPDDLIRASDRGAQAREDMRAGIPASESEAAQEMIREHAKATPRLKKHTDAFAAFVAGLDSRIPEWEYKGHELENQN
jgi:hypothetical protein